MSKYVNKNGTFNQHAWLREKSAQGSLNENVGNDFQKAFEFKAGDFMEEYLTHFEMLADEGKMPKKEYDKLDKMWSSAEKSLMAITNQLKKMSKHL